MKDIHDEWGMDDSFMAPPVRNPDNEWLGPMGIVGHVWEVNGAGAQEFSDFHPTKHELITLAKYWAEIAIDIEYFWFLFQQSGSSDIRRHPFAWARVGRIRDLLGQEVDAAVDEVYRTFGAKQDKEAWGIFLHGTSVQRATLQEEIQRSMERPQWRVITKLRRWTRRFWSRRERN